MLTAERGVDKANPVVWWFEEDGVVVPAYRFVKECEFGGYEFGGGGVADGFDLWFWLVSVDSTKVRSKGGVEMAPNGFRHTIYLPIPVNSSLINSVGALSGLKR